MSISWKAIGVASVLTWLLAGCATGPATAEETREVVLQYLGTDAGVGTAGPFAKGNQQELAVLSPADRAQAANLISRGASWFEIFAPPPAGATEPIVSRIIFVQRGKILADLRSPNAPATLPSAAAAAPAGPTAPPTPKPATEASESVTIPNAPKGP